MAFLTLTPKQLAGPGYVILNTIRVMNIIGLVAVISSSIVMVVKTVMSSQFYFFDGVSHLIRAFACIFLIISELPILGQYFLTHWPLLSPLHGFFTLGLAMIAIGADILGNLNKPSASQASLGENIWRSVISSGIIVLVLGFLNIIVGFVFSDRKRHVTARQIRAKGAVALTLGIADHPKQPPTISGPLSLTRSALSTLSSSIDSSPASSYKSASVVEAGLNNQDPVTPTPKQKNPTEQKTPGSYWNFGQDSAAPSRRASPVPSSYYSERGSGVFAPPPVGFSLAMNPQLAYLVRPDNVHQGGRK